LRRPCTSKSTDSPPITRRCISFASAACSGPAKNQRCPEITSSRVKPLISRNAGLTSTTRAWSSRSTRASVAALKIERYCSSLARSRSSVRLRSLMSRPM
jgi:hypothetical protein